MVWANEQGDLCFPLVCGHQAQWVVRNAWGYTPALAERSLATEELGLDRRQRCYACGDRESEAERAIGH
jgi:hypothetical protein